MSPHAFSFTVRAALEAAIQSAHVRAPEDSFVLRDGRVKPGHDDVCWAEDCP
jgi:hypothetical protein